MIIQRQLISQKAMQGRIDSEPLLFIDLVPTTAWFSNLRSELTGPEWELVKRSTFAITQYCCEACGGKGLAHPVECHERWLYDQVTRVQTLIRTVALCPACHQSTHYGLARVQGHGIEAKKHIMLVNGWTANQVEQHIRETMKEWKNRSNVKWKMDARWLLDFVPLSETTTTKILTFAKGLGERVVSGHQTNIVARQMRKL